MEDITFELLDPGEPEAVKVLRRELERLQQKFQQVIQLPPGWILARVCYEDVPEHALSAARVWLLFSPIDREFAQNFHFLRDGRVTTATSTGSTTHLSSWEDGFNYLMCFFMAIMGKHPLGTKRASSLAN
ncbi:MAG: hypothetical protein WA001_02895 [Patescibacteria group bacterium]